MEELTHPDPIRSTDIEVLKRHRDNPPAWSSMSSEELETYQRVHDFLEFAARTSVHERPDLEFGLTSGFTPRSGVRGARPKDLWCAIFNRTNKAFMYMPQVFMIISGRGIEIGFCPAIHRSDFSNQQLKRALAEKVPELFDRFPDADSGLIAQLVGTLRDQGRWHFRDKARRDPGDADNFDSLEELVRYIKSEKGKKWGAAAISTYIQPSSLDSPGGTDVLALFNQTLSDFNPLLEACRMTGAETKTAPVPTQPRYWVEKTLVKGRPTREEGPHRLGLAL